MASVLLHASLFVFAVTTLLTFTLRRRLHALHKAERKLGPRASTFVLSYSPNRIGVLDVLALLFAIIAKYIPFSSTYAQPLKTTASNDGFRLPVISFSGFLRITQKDLTDFRRSLQPHSRHAEQENPLLLVALTAPLLPIILAHGRCPVKPLGAVNTRNKFVFHHPSFCRDAARILSSSANGDMTYKATFGGESRTGIRVKRGMEFSVGIEVRCAGQLVLAQELEFLQFLPKNVKPVWRGEASAPSQDQPHETVAEDCKEPDDRVLNISATKPRQWAQSSKDWNPIHVSSLMARCFGFNSAIAHGNHVVALALQEVLDEQETRAGEPAQVKGALWGPKREKQIRKLSVSFLKPVFVPARLQARWTASGTDYRVDIATSKDWERAAAEQVDVKPRVEVAIEAY